VPSSGLGTISTIVVKMSRLTGSGRVYKMRAL
jgi:hypothetical protein